MPHSHDLALAFLLLTACKFPYPDDVNDDGRGADGSPGDAGLATRAIAFTSDREGNDDIFTMRLDNSLPVNLTNHPASDFSPLWSPSGDRIAFLSNRSGAQELYVMRADGTELMNLSRGQAAAPVWAPDGARLAFASTRTGSAELYRVRTDGTPPTPMTFDATDSMYLQVDWSPDGTRLVYTNARQLALIDADGSNQRVVANSLYIIARWSPDGNSIAVMQRPMLFHEIYVTDRDGANSVNLTNTAAAHETDPQWSPDSTRIAMVGSIAMNNEILVMGAGGGAPINWSMTPSSDQHPRWSSDGTRIIFSSLGDVFVVAAAGGGIVNLTNSPSADREAEWMP